MSISIPYSLEVSSTKVAAGWGLIGKKRGEEDKDPPWSNTSKLGVDSLADLFWLAEKAALHPPKNKRN